MLPYLAATETITNPHEPPTTVLGRPPRASPRPSRPVCSANGALNRRLDEKLRRIDISQRQQRGAQVPRLQVRPRRVGLTRRQIHRLAVQMVCISPTINCRTPGPTSMALV